MERVMDRARGILVRGLCVAVLLAALLGCGDGADDGKSEGTGAAEEAVQGGGEGGGKGEGVAAALVNLADQQAFAAACAQLGEAGVWDERAGEVGESGKVASAVVRLLGAKRYNRSLARGAMGEILAGGLDGSQNVVGLRERWLELRGRKQRLAGSVLVELRLDAERGGRDAGDAGRALEALRGEVRIAEVLEGLGDWIADEDVRVLIESLPADRVQGGVKEAVLAVFDDALTRLHGRYGEEDILNGLSNDGVVVACVGQLSDEDLTGRLREALTYAVHRRGYSMGYGQEMAELVKRLEGLAGR